MVRMGGIWTKGAAPRSTRFFGRQFYDPVERPPKPEMTGLLRARLQYRYPRPWKTQDPEVWRHPDHPLRPPYFPQHPGHALVFTHLCYDRDHVDKIQPALLQANPHLKPGK